MPLLRYLWSLMQPVRLSRSPLRRRRMQVEPLEDRRMLALVPQLVKDINAVEDPNAASTLIYRFVDIGDIAIFRATSRAEGEELWRTDGTSSGTFIVRDIFPGSEDSNNSISNQAFITNVNGVAYFISNDGIHGTELWKSDGTCGGTVLVRDLSSGNRGSNPWSLTNVNGTLYFFAEGGTAGTGLWKSDGTCAGTVFVKDFVTVGTSPNYITNVDGVVFFRAFTSPASDELWKSDGSCAGTVLVRDIRPGGSGSGIRSLSSFDGQLYFSADDGTHGRELWKSDGTSSGTSMVQDIRMGSASASPSNLVSVNAQLLFLADDGIHGQELWVTDGTSDGTELVADIAIGASGASAEYLTEAAGQLLFKAIDGSSRESLWKSDGTSSGTTQVFEIDFDTLGVGPRYLTNVNGIVFFRANDGISGRELWKSNGTSSGTSMVADINPGSGNGTPYQIANIRSNLYFRASNGLTGSEFWRSDGTSSGTLQVREIGLGAVGSYVGGLVELSGKVYFTADDGVNGFKLWSTDSTSSGTALINATIFSREMTNVNGVLYFAESSSLGRELWKTDGTSAGTVIVADIAPGLGSSSPVQLTNVNGVLYFVANDGTRGDELWTSDGTSAGTRLVHDLNPGSASSRISSLVNVNGILYFDSTNGITGEELWRTDGSSTGVMQVSDIVVGSGSSYPAELTNVNGTIFFTARNSTSGIELWKSDGTVAGTIRIRDIWPGLNGSAPRHLSNINGVLFFSANDGTSGGELWKSDGTSAGTILVRDIFPGFNDSDVEEIVEFHGLAYFSASDGVYGSELWRSDGTSSGTFLVADINPGTAPSMPLPAEKVVLGNRLLFEADNGVLGSELWMLEDPLPAVSLSLQNDVIAENGGVATVIVQLSKAATQDVTVSLTLSNTATNDLDYSTGATSIMLPVGQTSGSITLTGIDDATFEGSESIVVDICSVTNATELGTQQVVVTITDDDPIPNVSLSLVGSPLNENGGTATLTATLSNPSINDVTVDFSYSGTATSIADYSLSTAQIVIPAGQTSGSLALIGIDDATFEGSESIIVDVISVTGGIENGTQQVVVTIADDDPEPNVSLSVVGSSLNENGGAATITATLSNPSVNNVTVELSYSGTATNNADYSRSGAQIVIPAGQLTGSITLTGIDDLLNDSNETIVVDISGVTNGTENNTQQVTVTLVDVAPDPFTITGNTLSIAGSSGNDTLTILFDSLPMYSVNINGLASSFDSRQVSDVSFDALAGNDTLVLSTFRGAPDSAFFSTTSVSASVVSPSGGYSFFASNLEYKYLFGDPLDSASFSGSEGDDQMYQLPFNSIMLDGALSFYNQAVGFRSVSANAATGNDILLVYGTSGNDTYEASTNGSTMTAGGVTLVGNDFDQVFAFGSGGNDAATFTGSSGDDVFYGLGGYGYSVVNNATFLQYLIGFSQTTVAAGGGNDGAIFFDAGGNDTFNASPTTATMSGLGYSDTATGFDQVFAFATGGGVDTANLDGSDQDDLFSGNAFNAALFRTVNPYLIQVYNFRQVNANLSSSSGTDLAELIDGLGDDVLNASGSTAEITYAAGNKIKLSAFDVVYAKNQNGGMNTRQVVDPLAFQMVFEGSWG